MANYIDYLKSENLFEDASTEIILQGMVEDYQGTCKFLSEDDYNWLDENGQFMAFDEHLFRCDCGWWCDVSEEHDEGYCGDCEPDE